METRKVEFEYNSNSVLPWYAERMERHLKGEHGEIF